MRVDLRLQQFQFSAVQGLLILSLLVHEASDSFGHLIKVPVEGFQFGDVGFHRGAGKIIGAELLRFSGELADRGGNLTADPHGIEQEKKKAQGSGDHSPDNEQRALPADFSAQPCEFTHFIAQKIMHVFFDQGRKPGLAADIALEQFHAQIIRIGPGDFKHVHAQIAAHVQHAGHAPAVVGKGCLPFKTAEHGLRLVQLFHGELFFGVFAPRTDHMIVHFQIQGAFEFLIEICSRIGTGQDLGILAVDGDQRKGER